MTDHPIAPPPELVEQWLEQSLTSRELAAKAFEAGADQELEECCEYLARCAAWLPEDVQEMLDLRRPKPPSLKEQALKALDDISIASFEQAAANIIRRALEALPND